MFSGLLSVAVAIWYFLTARELGKNVWVWGAIGFICFKGAFTVFTKFIYLPVSMFTPNIHTDTLFNSTIWVLVTALSTVFVLYVRTNYLKGSAVAKESTTDPAGS